MKLALSAGAIALSMALVGCGGGGSSSPQGMMDDDDTEQMACAEGEVRQGTMCQEMCDEGYTATAGQCMMAEAEDPSETTEVATGRAMGLFNALTDDPQVGETILGTSTNVHTPTISRGVSGAASVSINGESGWEAGDAAPSISGWAGTRLNRGEESYVVYTNIEAAKRKAFLTYYRPADTDGDGTPDYEATAPLKGVTGATINYPQATANPGETAFGRVTFSNTAIEIAGRLGRLDPSKFPQPKAAGEGDNEFEYVPNTQGKKDPSFLGTYHGAGASLAWR